MAAAAAGYLTGTVPSADLAARLATGDHTDLHHDGTGNPGALNTSHLLGTGWGVAVLVGDIGKGAAAGRLGRLVAGDTGAHIAASAAVIGHCYPVWNGFRGGKGVATSIGQVLATFPVYFPIDFAVGAATMAAPTWKRRTFAATAVASAVWVGMATVWWRRGLPNLWGPAPSAALPAAAALSSAVIMMRFIQEGIGELETDPSGS